MLKEFEGRGKTLEEARNAALIGLNAPASADVHVEVVQMPKKKVLGLFGGSDAVVKVSYDDGKREKKPQPRREAPAQPKKQAQRSDKPQKAEKQSAPRAAKADKPRAPKADKPARAPKADKPREKATVQLSDADLNSACLYLKRLIEGLQVEDPQVAGILKDGLVEITIDCEDYGIIIGHRGETLDALQYLTSLQIKKQTDKYVRVALNVGNYREKRQETLKNLAKKNAAYVLRTGKRYTFEPMNPYERRILHTAIQEVEGVTSRSIGVDQNRRVVLEPEGGVTNTGNDRERYNRGSRGGRRGGVLPRRKRQAAAIVRPAASLRQPPRQTGQTCPSSARSKCRKRRSPLRKQPLLHLRRNKSKYQRRNRRATTAPPFLYFAGRYIIIGINNILGFVKTENVGSDPHIGPW